MIVQETVQGKFDSVAKPEPCDISLLDFDGTKYRVFIDPGAPTLMYISVWVRCYAECYENGAAEMIANVYEGLFTDEAEEGFDLTLCFDVAAPPRDPATLVDLCANLKRNILAAPFERAFMAVKDRTAAPEPCALPFRENETCFLFPSDERVTVIFNVSFDDPNEQAIARVFMQEFAEAKQRVKSGPPVSLSRDAPRELHGLGVEVGPGHVGYLTFGEYSRCVFASFFYRRYRRMLLLLDFAVEGCRPFALPNTTDMHTPR
jgi:actin related protein 2/3 complex subunit 2